MLHEQSIKAWRNGVHSSASCQLCLFIPSIPSNPGPLVFRACPPGDLIQPSGFICAETASLHFSIQLPTWHVPGVSQRLLKLTVSQISLRAYTPFINFLTPPVLLFRPLIWAISWPLSHPHSVNQQVTLLLLSEETWNLTTPQACTRTQPAPKATLSLDLHCFTSLQKWSFCSTLAPYLFSLFSA